MERCPRSGKALLPSYLVKGVETARGGESDRSCHLPQRSVLLLTSFHCNFPPGPLQTILLPPHPQVTAPLGLCSELQRRKETELQTCSWGLAFAQRMGGGRSPVPRPELGSESTELRMDVEAGIMLCGLRLNVGHTSAGLQKPFRKALADSREYLQLKYWSDYIICGALQANLFAAFSICHSVSMVSRLVRDGIFKPNRQSLTLKS